MSCGAEQNQLLWATVSPRIVLKWGSSCARNRWRILTQNLKDTGIRSAISGKNASNRKSMARTTVQFYADCLLTLHGRPKSATIEWKAVLVSEHNTTELPFVCTKDSEKSNCENFRCTWSIFRRQKVEEIRPLSKASVYLSTIWYTIWYTEVSVTNERKIIGRILDVERTSVCPACLNLSRDAE